MLLGIDAHGAQLDDIKRAAEAPGAHLLVKRGAARGEFGRQNRQQHHRPEEQQPQQGDHDVKRTLHLLDVEHVRLGARGQQPFGSDQFQRHQLVDLLEDADQRA